MILIIFGVFGSGVTIRNRRAVEAANRADQQAVPAGLRARVASAPADALLVLQQRVRSRPDDFGAWASLGSAYLERARSTGDPSWYPKAEGSYQQSLDTGPAGNFLAEAGMAVLASARHDFVGALQWAQKAAASNPDAPAVLAARGDALVELGRYDEAFDDFQRLVNLRPDTAAYARVSYARELQGDMAGALAAMELARDAAGTRSERAFADHYLGEIQFSRGSVDEAVSLYRRAGTVDPEFVLPEGGLARSRWAQGRPDEAVEAYRKVLNRLPSPQYGRELGDLFTTLGRGDEAQATFDLLEAQRRILAANGVSSDLELALFSADHAIRLDEGLAAVEAMWSTGRRSIQVADARAWQLYAHGRYNEALVMADEALKLGTANASFYYHRGMIRSALGRTDEARQDLSEALRINPYFSIGQSARAKAALAAF